METANYIRKDEKIMEKRYQIEYTQTSKHLFMEHESATFWLEADERLLDAYWGLAEMTDDIFVECLKLCVNLGL